MEGGYKAYRRYIHEQLNLKINQIASNLLVIAGKTGSGKTKILHKLSSLGHQTIDLECLAKHRGSVLGGKAPQPSQKEFEANLYHQIKNFDPNLTTYIESESYRINRIHLPLDLWKAMKAARVLKIEVPLEKRVKFLIEDYQELLADPDYFSAMLTKLNSNFGKKTILDWQNLIREKNWQELISDLLVKHYDPAYQKSEKNSFQKPEKIIFLDEVSCPLNELLYKQQ